MPPPLRLSLLALLALPLLSGCLGTVKSIITAPVKIVGQTADWATTSQDEADRNRGRELRHREEELGKLGRQRDKAAEQCRDGDEEECQRAKMLDQEIDARINAPG